MMHGRIAGGLAALVLAASAQAQVAVRAQTLYPVAGPAIADGVVVITAGKIAAVGPAASTPIPAGHRVLTAAVAVPGLVDGRSTVGLSGMLNQPHDQDQLDPSEPMQPELRALDAFDGREPLVAWVRSFGVTTLHTGHAPGALISGQTMVVKTRGGPVAGAVVEAGAAVAATLGSGAAPDGGSPGTRSKAAAMLRGLLVKAQAWAEKDDAEPDLRLERVAAVLRGDVPLLVTAHRQHDILTALRLQREFGFRLILDGAAEAYLVLAELQAAAVPVLAHAPMARHQGELKNGTFELGARLADAGIPFAYQSGHEGYVPKTRVVLLEAAVGAAHGLGFERALEAITLAPARILGVADRIGSLEAGKDGDVALYDGDPFEYLTHCTATVIEGEVVFEGAR